MRKLIISLIAVVLVVMAGSFKAEAADQPRNIILIGWDGAQRAHVKECLGRNELPNLKRLSEEGTLVEIDIEGTTDTKAGWTQILTGYYPKVTGVYSNQNYQPIPKGLSVFERLEKHFGADGIVTMAVIGKSKHVDANGPTKVKVTEGNEPGKKNKRKNRGTIIEENGVKYRVTPGKPYYYTKDGMDLFENGLVTNVRVGTRSLELIEKNKDKRFFMFVHFAEVDTKGHKFGENSKEYNDALISSDEWTGKIMKKLGALGLYDKTLIYVTADHGFDEGMKAHKNAPYVFLGTNDKKVIRNGLRQDITPTILERFGVDVSKLEPPLDGVSLTKAVNRAAPVLGPQKKVERVRAKKKAA